MTGSTIKNNKSNTPPNSLPKYLSHRVPGPGMVSCLLRNGADPNYTTATAYMDPVSRQRSVWRYALQQALRSLESYRNGQYKKHKVIDTKEIKVCRILLRHRVGHYGSSEIVQTLTALKDERAVGSTVKRLLIEPRSRT